MPSFAADPLPVPPFAAEERLRCTCPATELGSLSTAQLAVPALIPLAFTEVNPTENHRICPDIAPFLCSQPAAEQRKIASTLTVEEFSEAVLEGTKSVVLSIL